MKSLKSYCLLAATVFLIGCAAGVNFVKPAPEKLVLGTTTKEQTTALLGKANGQGQKVANGETLATSIYAYAKVGGDAALPGITPARAMGLLFHNNVLVGTEYTSSFKADSTLFDFDKAKSIKQGMKSAEVTALLGKAGGEYRYPLVANKNGSALVYSFTQTKGFKSQQNLLVVELDEKGIVLKSDFTQAGML